MSKNNKVIRSTLSALVLKLDGLPTQLDAFRQRLDPQASRWPFHITLQYPFLSPDCKEFVQTVNDVAATTCREFAPFGIEFSSCKTFPSARGHVLWLDPRAPELHKLHQSLVSHTHIRGSDSFGDSKRQWQPHATIGQEIMTETKAMEELKAVNVVMAELGSVRLMVTGVTILTRTPTTPFVVHTHVPFVKAEGETKPTKPTHMYFMLSENGVGASFVANGLRPQTEGGSGGSGGSGASRSGIPPSATTSLAGGSGSVSSSAPGLLFLLDFSGSMSGAYSRQIIQTMQWVHEKVTKAGQNPPVIAFNHGIMMETSLSEFLKHPPTANGGTCFAPVFERVRTHFVPLHPTSQVMFFTDGECSDAYAFRSSLKELTSELHGDGRAHAHSCVVYVIGFGPNISAGSATDITSCGTTPGIFQLGTDLASLQTKFQDLFYVATTTLRVQCDVEWGKGLSFETDLVIRNEEEEEDVAAEGEEEEGRLPCEGRGSGKFKGDGRRGCYALQHTVLVTKEWEEAEAKAGWPRDVWMTVHWPDATKAPPTRLLFGFVPHPNPVLRMEAFSTLSLRSVGQLKVAMRELSGLEPKGMSFEDRLRFGQTKTELLATWTEHLRIANSEAKDNLSQLKLKDLEFQATCKKARHAALMEQRRSTNLKDFRGMDLRLTLLQQELLKDPKACEYLQRQYTDTYSCVVTLSSPWELMSGSTDDFMGWGLFLTRDTEQKILYSPATAVRVGAVAHTSVSNHAYIDSMQTAIATRGDLGAHGGFKDSSIAAAGGAAAAAEEDEGDAAAADDQTPFCMVGASREKINALFPLFLSEAHARRVAMLRRNWMGWLFALSPFLYDKKQEVALLGVFAQCIERVSNSSTGGEPLLSEFNHGVVSQMAQTIEYMLRTSPALHDQLNDGVMKAYVTSFAGRGPEFFDSLSVPVVFAALGGGASSSCSSSPSAPSSSSSSVDISFPTVVRHTMYEVIKRQIRQQFAASEAKARVWLHELLYAVPPREAAATATGGCEEVCEEGEGKEKKGEAAADKGARSRAERHIETAFEEWFTGLRFEQPDLRPALLSEEERKRQVYTERLLQTEPNLMVIDKILSTLVVVPRWLVQVVRVLQTLRPELKPALGPGPTGWKDVLGVVPGGVDESGAALRAELVAAFHYFNVYPPAHVTPETVLHEAHTAMETIRRSQHLNADRVNLHQRLGERIALTDNLFAWAGMLRGHCPTRGGETFTKAVEHMIRRQDAEKLCCLLRNSCHGEPIFRLSMVWVPTSMDMMIRIATCIGYETLIEIEKEHVAAKAQRGHMYRSSDKPNRHTHCNSNPFEGLTGPFDSYGVLASSCRAA